jgi:hypothetical protein
MHERFDGGFSPGAQALLLAVLWGLGKTDPLQRCGLNSGFIIVVASRPCRVSPGANFAGILLKAAIKAANN